jgi:hypothetical protein
VEAGRAIGRIFSIPADRSCAASLKWLFARSLRNKLEKDLVDALVMLTTES